MLLLLLSFTGVRNLVVAAVEHLSKEALDLVAFQGVAAVLLLDKADHRLVTVRVEVIEFAHLPQFEDVRTLGICLVFSDLFLHNADIFVDWLGPVCKVGDEAHAIIELNEQRLVVQDVPSAIVAVQRLLALEVAVRLAPRAFDGPHLLVVEHLHFPGMLILELELVGLSDDLHLVRHLVSAHFLRVEQVDLPGTIAGDVESPGAADVRVSIRATHGLVSCDHDQ